jgi:PKD repeat protein
MNASGQANTNHVITVTPASTLAASFTFSPASPTAGQSVQFTDTSAGSPTSWQWNFGDGTNASVRNPSHSFATAGSYSVTLTASNSTASDGASRAITVSPSAKLTASFTYNPSAPAVGKTVQFSDASTGTPTSWQWNFGDGVTSTVKDPSHTYGAGGSYSVTLAVQNASYQDSLSKTITVTNANVITAASPALSDVQAAIGAANPGDTVMVPAGSATWNSNLVITKGIRLIGAGSSNTIITGNYSNSGYTDTSGYLLSYAPDATNRANNTPFRLSGFTIDPNSKCQGVCIYNISTTAISNIRIDHNTIKRGRQLWVVIRGNVYGVADNNYIDHSNNTSPDCIDHLGIQSDAWKYLTFNFGTANNFYWEDNILDMKDGDCFDCCWGGRYCARYNVLNDVSASSGEDFGFYPAFNNHGNQGSAEYSSMGCEIYRNTINAKYEGVWVGNMRGGKVLVYNNNIVGNGIDVTGAVVREDSDGYDWNTLPAVNAISGQPQHISDSYFWNNTQNGTVKLTHKIDMTLNYTQSPYRVTPQWDLDCWKETTGFGGSSGMGVGPLSARPTSCTLEGAAWWASDESRMYRWHNGMWELFYTPYPYPHPLRTVLD